MKIVPDFPIYATKWPSAVRIIRSAFPPVDLFDDIADPTDWALINSAEQKTNPRISPSIGGLDLVPINRRVTGPGSSYLMAPFVHVTEDRKSRFGNGKFGVLYAADCFETALFETIHHHGVFMRQTSQPAGWTSQFRELLLVVDAKLRDLRRSPHATREILDRDNYEESQWYANEVRARGDDGIIYPSVRCDDGDCTALFYPDLASGVRQGRHLDYHWDGDRVDYIRDHTNAKIFRVSESR